MSKAIPSDSHIAANRSSFCSSGGGCTRKMVGARRSSNHRATVSLASSISSSMSWYARLTPGSSARRVTSTGSRVVGSRMTFASGSSKSSAPRFMRRARRTRESSSATRKPSTIASAAGSRVASADSPSARATPPYVSFARDRISPRTRRLDTTRPVESTWASTHRQSRSTSGRSEQRFDESARGSIGIARSGKYTLQPRAFASSSSAVPGVT